MEKRVSGIIRRAPAPPQLYRKPHDVEIRSYDDRDWRYGGDGYRSGLVRNVVRESGNNLPEVYRVAGFQTSLPCPWIKLWRALNPDLSLDKFETLLGNSLAWTNRTGWPGRYNCLTGENSDANDPAYHACIVNGGALLKGTEQDGNLEVETLRNTDVPPDPEYVLTRPWLWFWGTAVTPEGKINLIKRKGLDGELHPVRVPLITSQPLEIPLTWLHKLPLGFIPDPTWMA